MMRYARGQLGVVPPIMHPAERMGAGQGGIYWRIIRQQPAEHRRLRLGVIGRDRQGIAHLLLLPIERDASGGQALLQFRRRHVRVAGQGLLQPLAQRVRQAAGLQPGQRLVIQAVAEILSPDDRQDILTRTVGTGVATREPGIANRVAHLVLPVHAGAGLVGGDPRPGGKARPMNGRRFVRPASIRVQQRARQRAGADPQTNIPQEG